MATSSVIIDITDIDTVRLLKKMCDKEPAIFFKLSNIEIPTISDDEIRLCISKGYVDYCCGRLIKTSFELNCINSTSYDNDRIHNKMSLLEIVNDIRKEMNEDNS